MKNSSQTMDYAGANIEARYDGTERRAAPRHELTCSALLRLSELMTFRCTLRDLSLRAVQVECDPCYALLIQPMGAGTAPDANRVIEVSIALPHPGLARGFRARCRVKHCSQAPDRNMLLGLEFVDVEEVAYAALERLIDDLD